MKGFGLFQKILRVVIPLVFFAIACICHEKMPGVAAISGVMVIVLIYEAAINFFVIKK